MANICSRGGALLRSDQGVERTGILYLTNNDNALPLFDWLSERTEAEIYSDRLELDDLKKYKPSIIISYNYSYIIEEKIIDYMDGNIINMHISYLPYNRGFSPNLWSFIDDTPKGVTIHRVSAGLDKGAILCQKELFFDEEKETFASAYDKLQQEIVSLFKENWEALCNGYIEGKEQIGSGTYHSMKDLEEFKDRIRFSWDDNIAEVKRRYCYCSVNEG